MRPSRPRGRYGLCGIVTVNSAFCPVQMLFTRTVAWRVYFGMGTTYLYVI
jgi:hypothetical protein